MSAKTMRAIIYKEYGTPDVLELQEVAKPSPKEKEVLVRVYATTVNRTDCGVLSGKPLIFRLFLGGWLRPKNQIAGTTYAGQVEAVGSQVSTFKKGDRVFGFHDHGLGAYAQYLTIAADKEIALLPDNCTYEQGAASTEGAHYALNFLNKIKLEKGQKVLVNGATGAIGSATVQLLKYDGIEVTAVGNTKNLDLLKQIGADTIYNYEQEDFTQKGGKYQFVLDAVGKSTFAKCKPLLLPNGAYISSELGPNAQNLYLPLLTKFSDKKVIFPIPSDLKKSILFIQKLLAAGKYHPVIDDKQYSLDEIAEAFKYVATGEKTGNVVIKIP